MSPFLDNGFSRGGWPTTRCWPQPASTVKKAAGRLHAPDDLLDVLTANRFDTLAITAAHAVGAGQLPPHHADPFDRILIAQAQMDGLTLVSADRRFADYDVELLPLG